METLLLIGSGNAVYREDALRICAAHYALVLLHDYPITWQKPYVQDYFHAPLARFALVLTIARQLNKRYHFAGVFTYNEAHVELAAAVAHALHLPHNPVWS